MISNYEIKLEQQQQQQKRHQRGIKKDLKLTSDQKPNIVKFTILIQYNIIFNYMFFLS